ncbi:MAG: carboxypeptidase-like regulatory domain-containing protein [Telluria sp.]
MMQTSPLGRISGQVLRADREEVVADATIGITQAAGPVPDIAMVSDADGCFTLGELAAGTWTLRACGPAGESGEVSAHVAPGAVSTVRIRVR